MNRRIPEWAYRKREATGEHCLLRVLRLALAQSAQTTFAGGRGPLTLLSVSRRFWREGKCVLDTLRISNAFLPTCPVYAFLFSFEQASAACRSYRASMQQKTWTVETNIFG